MVPAGLSVAALCCCCCCCYPGWMAPHVGARETDRGLVPPPVICKRKPPPPIIQSTLILWRCTSGHAWFLSLPPVQQGGWFRADIILIAHRTLTGLCPRTHTFIHSDLLTHKCFLCILCTCAHTDDTQRDTRTQDTTFLSGVCGHLLHLCCSVLMFCYNLYIWSQKSQHNFINYGTISIEEEND